MNARASKLNRMNKTVTAEGRPREKPKTEKWARTRRFGRTLRQIAKALFPWYVAALMVVGTVQAVCLLLLWRPPQDWVSFGAKFFTSPAIAGFFALTAAIIGTNAVREQLAQTKEKAENDAWWQQFEWVTDRLMSADEETQLPMPFANALITSLSGSARTSFQHDAVEGIVEHYLQDFLDGKRPSVSKNQTSGPEGLKADAKSLRSLLDLLPASSASRTPVREVLDGYAYEEEVLKALRHQGYESIDWGLSSPAGEPDAVLVVGSETVLLEVKLSVSGDRMLERVANQLHELMRRHGAGKGLIVTPPRDVSKQSQYSLPENIQLVEWEPRMGSSKLKDRVHAALKTDGD